MLQGNLLYKRLFIPIVTKPKISQLFIYSQRNFCYRWMNKHRDHFYPTCWNTPDKRRGSNLRMSMIKYKTQDPLFLDPKIRHIDGGEQKNNKNLFLFVYFFKHSW